MQSFLLVGGPTSINIHKIYIVINDVKYEYENCLETLNIFFKIFHVMRIKYSPQSEHIYKAIEVVIFNSRRKCLKNYPHIQDIIENIKFDQ